MRYQLHLATSRKHRLRQISAVGLGVGTLLAFGMDAAQGPIPQPRFWLIFLSAGALAAMLTWGYIESRGGFVPMLLDLGETSLRLATARGQQIWEIPFQVLRLGRPDDGTRGKLIIAGPGIQFLLAAEHLVALDGQPIDNPQDALTLLEHQLLTRSRNVPLPGSAPTAESVAAWNLKETAGSSASEESPSDSELSASSPQMLGRSTPLGPATVTLSAILGLIFVAQWRLGATFDPATLNPMALLALGANSSPLVQLGEWQRLFTGNLLHGDLRHLLFNGLALVSFGRIVEGRLGSYRFLVIFLGSCLGGALASALLNNVLISVGASTGILGLVGAYGVLDLYFATDRKSALRRQLIMLSLALVLPALLVPNADHFGHLGGLLVGIVLTWWLVSPMDAITPNMLDAASRSPRVREVLVQWLPGGEIPTANQRDRHRIRLRLASALALLLVGGFTVVAVQTALRYVQHGEKPQALALLKVPDLPPYFANNAAWTIASDPKAPSEHLELAHRKMLWAENPETKPMAAEVDTLATLEYRLGRLDRAIQIQRRALAMAPDAVLVSQMARFQKARLDAHEGLGGVYLDGFAQPPAVHFRRAVECKAVAPLEAPTGDVSAVEDAAVEGEDAAVEGSEDASEDFVAEAEPEAPIGIEVLFPAAPADGPEGLFPTVNILLQRADQLLAMVRVSPLAELPQKVLCTGIPADLQGCDVEARLSLATLSNPLPWTNSDKEGASAPQENKSEESSELVCELTRLDPETLALP